jgi:hypothetical protein
MPETKIDHKAAARAAVATHAAKAHVDTKGFERDKANIETWHLLCSLIELCDAEHWDFDSMVEECREALACCSDTSDATTPAPEARP